MIKEVEWGLFINTNISYTIREDLSVFIPHIIETLFVETQCNTGSKNIIGVIYRPNTQPRADLDVFSETLSGILDIVTQQNRHCVLLGDFNIDNLKYNTHHKTNEFIDNLFSHGFMPFIHKPTRVTHQTATLLDHIYSNNLAHKSISGIILTDVSDHFGIYHIVHNRRKTHIHHANTRRIFSSQNQETFNELLRQTDFSDISQINCPQQAYNLFIDKYKTAFDIAFPLTQIKPCKRFVKREPWVSEGLLTSMRNKTKLFRKKLKQPSEHNIIKYKTFINQYNKLKRIMKTNYYRNMIEMNKHDMKKTWQILKQALGKLQNKSTFPQEFKIIGQTVTNKEDIAQEFNSYFATIGKITGQNVPQSIHHYSEYLVNPVPNSIFLEPINQQSVIEIVQKLNPKTSSGHDEIPTKVIKESINNFIDPITHILNLSLNTGVIPRQLKEAKVIPIYKASDPSLLQNYRPISLLPAFSKIFEKMIYNKIISFLNCQNILYKHQYGFRSKHSTIHPILHLLNHCGKMINTEPKELTLSVFCDLSKAFDVINRDILISKLEHYGLRGVLKDWIVNYLSDRTQFVDFDGHRSDLCDIDCGVPQGSILGPLLYLLYVNDISQASTANILSFADDTSLYISDRNLKTLYDRANVEINKLYQWFCANKLSLNAKKTNFIVLRSPWQKCNFDGLSLHINGVQLSQIGKDFNEPSIKFLGVYIDEHLSWKHHLSHINSKIARSLFMLKQVKHLLPINSLKTLYNYMIHPYITYGIIAWGSANASDLKRTFLLQKRAIRTINKAPYNGHTDPLFR